MSNTIPNSSRQTLGMGSTEGDDTIDIIPLGNNRNNADPGSRAPTRLPYQIETVVDEIGEVMLGLAGVRTRFGNVMNHPNLSEAQVDTLKKIDTKIEAIGKVLGSVTSDLDKLVVGAGQLNLRR